MCNYIESAGVLGDEQRGTMHHAMAISTAAPVHAICEILRRNSSSEGRKHLAGIRIALTITAIPDAWARHASLKLMVWNLERRFERTKTLQYSESTPRSARVGA